MRRRRGRWRNETDMARTINIATAMLVRTLPSARPLARPNDLTALADAAAVPSRPPAPGRPPRRMRRSNKESDCTFIFSAFCSKLSRNKSGRGAPQPPPLSCGGGERADGRSVLGRQDRRTAREKEGGGSVFFSPSQPSVEGAGAHKKEEGATDGRTDGQDARAGRQTGRQAIGGSGKGRAAAAVRNPKRRLE